MAFFTRVDPSPGDTVTFTGFRLLPVKVNGGKSILTLNFIRPPTFLLMTHVNAEMKLVRSFHSGIIRE